MDKKIILVRGGGDLASGVAVCLHEAGYSVVITELAQPLVVRRKVSFAEAVYEGSCSVEGITGRKADSVTRALDFLAAGEIAVLVDPDCECLGSLAPIVIVDGRMLKREVANEFGEKWRVIGLGPGFTAGVNCWVAIETNRGPNLGKIFHEGSPDPDTGLPAIVMGFSRERVIYAHREGHFKALVDIGDRGDVDSGRASVARRAMSAAESSTSSNTADQRTCDSWCAPTTDSSELIVSRRRAGVGFLRDSAGARTSKPAAAASGPVWVMSSHASSWLSTT